MLPLDVVDTLPAEALPAALAHLAALQARVAARLATGVAGNGNGSPQAEDRLLSVKEAAEVLHVTVDWLRRHPELPFVVSVSPGQMRYSARGLQRYIAGRLRR